MKGQTTFRKSDGKRSDIIDKPRQAVCSDRNSRQKINTFTY